MARPTRYKPVDSSRRRAWIYLAVVSFILVDVFLISWALGARSDGTALEPNRPIPTFTPNQATATPTPEAAATIAIPSTRLLSALDETTAWRATTGQCPTALAAPELSTDAGATWLKSDATSDVQLTALQRVTVLSNTLVELVGLSAEDCAPQFAKSLVAGDDYSNYPDQLADQWYVDPVNRSVVHTPAGDVAAPCASVVAISPSVDVDAAAGVLCADTNVFTTDNFAETWSNPVQIPGAVNLSVTGLGYIIATVGLPQCAGVQLISLSVDPLVATPTGCLPVDATAETMQGNVAIADGGGSIWVWAGDSVKRSIDQGTSWS